MEIMHETSVNDRDMEALLMEDFSIHELQGKEQHMPRPRSLEVLKYPRACDS